jgi:hypothetical protein
LRLGAGCRYERSTAPVQNPRTRNHRSPTRYPSAAHAARKPSAGILPQSWLLPKLRRKAMSDLQNRWPHD